MKLINNRYRINDIIKNDQNEEIYVVEDLWNQESTHFMKILDIEKHDNIISYYINNFLMISQLKHKNLLYSDRFGIVETINLKKANTKLYYVISEYNESTLLNEVVIDLSLSQRLKIILDLMSVIDYLHFRGVTYKYLSPAHIYYSSESGVKLHNYSSILEKTISSYYDSFSEDFIAPEVLMNQPDIKSLADYYSLGMVMKFLLLKDYSLELQEDLKFIDEFNLTIEQKSFLSYIINNLTKKAAFERNIRLRDHIDNIISAFSLDYNYNLIAERNEIFLKNKTIGFESEIGTILDLETQIDDHTNSYSSCLVWGGIGSGKTKLLDEVAYRLKYKGKEAYKIDVLENDTLGINNITNLLRVITSNNQDVDILNQYKDDFSSLLPELMGSPKTKDLDLSQVNEKYRIFNRINNFISDISKEKFVYIIIDNIEKANDNFISLIDYLINNIKYNKVFLIMSINEAFLKSSFLSDKLLDWDSKKLLNNISLKNLSFENTAELVKSILGIAYTPKEFASVLYRESKGNPKYIDFIIKDLYNRKEIFLSKNGYWDVAIDDYTKLTFPTSFSDTIINQLKKYNGDYLRVIKAMSIHSSMLSKRMLLNIIKLDPYALEIILDDLIQDRIIEEKNADWGYSYGLYSGELKRFVYLDMSDEEKFELHQKAANSIMELYYDRLKIVIEELVHHLIKSNDIDLAIDILIKEAEKIENRYSSNAITLWEMAYSIISDRHHKEKLKILDTLTDLFLLKSDINKIELYINRLKKEAEELNSVEYMIKTYYYKAELLLRTNELDELNLVVTKLENISRENNVIDGIISALLTKARMQLSTDSQKGILETINEAVDLSIKYNNRFYLGSLYNIIGLNHYLSGNIEDALKEYMNSINYYEESNKPFEVVKPINNIGQIYAEYFGDIDKALEYYGQALEIADKYGLIQLQTTFLNNIGEVYLNTLDYKMALEYIKDARRLAEECNDIRLVFLANINLGYIYLYTNQLDKANNIYQILINANANSPILDTEINNQYNNFLSEYFINFGKMNLALKQSKITSTLYKDFNIKDYLISETRILCIKYLIDGYIDKEEMHHIINKYSDAGFVPQNLKYILYLAKLCLLNEDKDNARKLLVKYKKLNPDSLSDYLDSTYKILDLLITEDYDEVENILFKMSTGNLVSVDMDFHLYLGTQYRNQNDYAKSLRHLLEALDCLFKTCKNIQGLELKQSLICLKKGDYIKESITFVFKEGYGKNISYLKTEFINEDNYDLYFDLCPIIDLLTKEEFNEILDIQEESSYIKNIEELLLHLNDDYVENLSLILKYIGRETLAKRGFIITTNEGSTPKVLVSLVPEDNKMPDDIILINALRNKGPFLINRSSKDVNKSKYEEFISSELNGLICIPICTYDRYPNDELERRRWETIENNRLLGYIYLETYGALNRFDNERCKLITSLSNLIYLNIENNQLRTLSTTDKVTGVFTRKFFENRFENLINIYKHTDNRFSVLMIDIDKFKSVNDTYGHLKGDEVLSLIGTSIKNSVRTSDIVGRYGGEEFIVILQNTTILDGISIGEKIRDMIQKLEVPGINRQITVSIGISQYPDHSQTKDELIFKADQALYYAKEILGRNKKAIWYPGMEITTNKIDKLTGLIDGDPISDNRNLLAMVDISELVKEKKECKKKAYDFLSRIIEVVDGEYASLVLLENGNLSEPLTRKRKEVEWIQTNYINEELVKRVLKTKKGEYLVDWDNIESIDKITGNPNWQSILIIPLIKFGEIKGIVYVTVPLKEHEFKQQNLNLAIILSNIFSSNI